MSQGLHWASTPNNISTNDKKITQYMNDTKDIQTIRHAIVTDHIDTVAYLAATEALSRLEARLSAHQEVVSALGKLLISIDINGGEHTHPIILHQARAALARAKEGQS
jgi:hypothetical protein